MQIKFNDFASPSQPLYRLFLTHILLKYYAIILCSIILNNPKFDEYSKN